MCIYKEILHIYGSTTDITGRERERMNCNFMCTYIKYICTYIINIYKVLAEGLTQSGNFNKFCWINKWNKEIVNKGNISKHDLLNDTYKR
jgi:hypothetical protein